MSFSRAFFSGLFILLSSAVSARSAELPHTLALGATYVGGQVHWGFANKWALEARALKAEEENQTSTAGNITAYAYGVRTYRYFRSPSRARIYMGLEAASTRSYSDNYDYNTTGFALGGFGGTEIYLLRRLSLGLDIGPYVVSSRIRNGNASEGELSIVVNTYMNFYLL